MYKKFMCLASIVIVFSLSSAVSYAQLLGSYNFDGGGDGTSWSDPNNWEQVTDPNGAPLSGNPATSPGPLTTANVPQLGVTITAAGQTALDANIGTTGGAGSLTLSAGGALAAGRDFNVGAGDPNGSANGGTFNMTGGTLAAGDDIFVGLSTVGTMTMSGGAASTGDDFFIQNTSSFNMTGGTVHVGDRLVMTGNASLTNNGGDIVADDDFFFFGDSQVTVNSGTMVVLDKLRFDGDPNMNGKLTINSGLVRSDEFHFNVLDPNTDFRGVVEINGDGVYEVQNKAANFSNLDVATARFLINQGIHFITGEVAPKQLQANPITIPIGGFFGNTVPLSFTQILVVPEPASMLLLSLGGLGLLLRRKRAR